MLGNPGSGVLLTPGLAGHKLGPGQCPVRSPLAAGSAIVKILLFLGKIFIYLFIYLGLETVLAL